MNDKEYVLGIKKYILVVTIIFVVSIFIGSILTDTSSDVEKKAKDLAYTKVPDLSKFERVFDIFIYNVGYSLLSIVLFGAAAIYVAFMNGFVIGMLLNFVGKIHGVWFVVLELIPHGIIEIPALLISASIGLRIGHVWWGVDWWSGCSWSENMSRELVSGIRFYIKWIVPMLLIAAFIESYISQELWNYLDLLVRYDEAIKI